VAGPTKTIQENCAEDDQATTEVDSSSPGKAQVNGGPLIELESVNGSSTKSSSKSNIQSPQKSDNKKSSPQESSSDASTNQADVKKGKQNKEGKGSTGPFTGEEVSKLSRFKIDFCNIHGISGSTFDSMVQHSERDKGTAFPCESSVMTKPEFWKVIYGILPTRDRRSVYRFMRRHFQTSDVKPHQWNHEQDEELIQLVAQYGQKFAQIAKMIGRNDDDVVQRWKNKLQHRSTMNRGPWSEEEVRGLQNALQAAWKNFKEQGHDVGQDIYEMSETLISWGQISDKMGNCRSRQQCADKWRKARKKVMQLRDKGNPNAVYDPVTETTKKNRAKSQTISRSQTPEGQYKSAKYVTSDDEDEAEGGGERPDDKRRQKLETTESSTPGPVSESVDEAASDSGSDDDENDRKVSYAKKDQQPRVNGRSQHEEHSSGPTRSKKNVKSTQKRRKRTPEASTESASETDDSGTSSESLARKRAATGGKSKEASDSSSSGSESESEATSTSGPDKLKSSKKVTSNTVKPNAQASSSSGESSLSESGDDSESDGDDSDSSESESESEPNAQSRRAGKAGKIKQNSRNKTASTSTSARFSASQEVKMENSSE
jgi:hypothetical protein